MSGVHVIVGEDDFLVSEAAKKLILPGGETEIVDSSDARNEEAQLKDLARADAGFSTPPFFDPVKTTWWRNVAFLPQAGKSASSEAVKRALEAFARKIAAAPPPENQRFILSAPRWLSTSVFAKTLSAVAKVTAFAADKPWKAHETALARATARAKEDGIAFAPGAADAFVRRVGTDARSLESEWRKLAAYLEPGAKTVSAADVAAVASPGAGGEPVPWEVTDALAARDVSAALAATRRFEGQRSAGLLLSGACEKLFRQLAALKDADARGRLADATRDLNAYTARKRTAVLPKWTLYELRVAWRRFMQLRERCVSSASDSDALVFAEIVRACVPARKGAG